MWAGYENIIIHQDERISDKENTEAVIWPTFFNDILVPSFMYLGPHKTSPRLGFSLCSKITEVKCLNN